MDFILTKIICTHLVLGDHMALSEAWLKSRHKKTSDNSEEKTDRDGMGVRVSPKGKITFQMRFRFDGKAARLDLGVYPYISLKEAREKTHQMRGKLEQGFDPRIVKKMEKQAIVEALSFKALFDLWYTSYCVKNKKSHANIKRSFELHIFNELGELPIDSITIQHWLKVLERIIETGTPSIAEVILTNIKQLLNWGVRRQIIERNVLSDISPARDLQVVKGIGKRVLSDDEIKTIFHVLDNSKVAPKNKLFLKLCLVYGCRNGELRLSEKEHFDFENRIWTIPAENHKLGGKTGQPLQRPIIPEIEPFLREAFTLSDNGIYLFNNVSGGLMSRSATASVPYHMMQWIRKNLGYDMEHWSLHDLRRTARTNFSSLTQPHIAEIMLGHKLPGVWMTYDKHDYLEEQAEAYKKWWNRLEKIIQ